MKALRPALAAGGIAVVAALLGGPWFALLVATPLALGVGVGVVDPQPERPDVDGPNLDVTRLEQSLKRRDRRIAWLKRRVREMRAAGVQEAGDIGDMQARLAKKDAHIGTLEALIKDNRGRWMGDERARADTEARIASLEAQLDDATGVIDALEEDLASWRGRPARPAASLRARLAALVGRNEG